MALQVRSASGAPLQPSGANGDAPSGQSGKNPFGLSGGRGKVAGADGAPLTTDEASKASELLKNEEFVKALRAGSAKAYRMMKARAIDSSDPLAGVDYDSMVPHGTIIKEGWFGGYNYETGTYVVRGSQKFTVAPWLGETNFGSLTTIQDATAVVLEYPSHIDPNFEGVMNTFNQLDQVTPVFINSGGNSYVIEGNAGPFQVNY